MTIAQRKRVDRLIKDIKFLENQGIELSVMHGKYGDELTLVDNNANAPSDYIIEVIKTV